MVTMLSLGTSWGLVFPSDILRTYRTESILCFIYSELAACLSVYLALGQGLVYNPGCLQTCYVAPPGLKLTIPLSAGITHRDHCAHLAGITHRDHYAQLLMHLL